MDAGGAFGDFEPEEIDRTELATISRIVAALANCVEALNERLYALEARIHSVESKWN